MRLSTVQAARPLTAPEVETTVAGSDPEPAVDYLDHYGLARPPFGSAAAPVPFLRFNAHREVLEALLAGLRQGRGHLLLTGDHGVGKTTVLSAVLNQLADDARVVLRVSRLLPGPLTRARLIAQLLEIEEPDRLTPDLLTRARAVVSFRDRAAKPTLLVIDDAQYLSTDALEWILRIAGGRSANMPQVLLVGRPIVRKMLAPRHCKPFVDRVAHSLDLPPLGGGDMRLYVERRLWLAGSSIRRLISAPALRTALRRVEGSPGRIDTLLEAALPTGCMRGEPVLTSRTIRAVAGPKLPRTPRVIDWGRIVVVSGGLIFAIGVVAFVWRALGGS